MAAAKPTLAVWKFASCDGCQLSVIELASAAERLSDHFEIAFFLEMSRATVAGPYDVSLVEGSITTPADARRIQEVRRQSNLLVTIGACATAGGIQALRNLNEIEHFKQAVYASPEVIDTLATSTPIAEHVAVDIALHGCPIDTHQLREVLSAIRNGRRPGLSPDPVCTECKRRGTPCVMVAAGVPCLGPVTLSGCGAICPAYGRGCYGCFGPATKPNTHSLAAEFSALGAGAADIARMYRTFNAEAPEFRAASEDADARHDTQD